MNKEEFLIKMKHALDGQVSDIIITDNINYYTNYIDNEISNGKSENEVLDMLGDPRLLAKTVIELQGGENNENDHNSEYKKNNNYDEYNEYNKQNQNHSKRPFNSKYHSFIGLKGCLITIVVLFLLFTILRVVLSIAIFFAIPICIILIIIRLLKRFR